MSSNFCTHCKQVQHKMLCPWYPEFGYDSNGVPHTESQLPKAMYELGCRLREDYDNRLMKVFMEGLEK